MGIDPTDWHMRQALQIAAQLPAEPNDAWAILSCVEDLQRYLSGPPPMPAPPGGGSDQVVRFPGGSRGTSPRRRASSSGRPSGLPKNSQSNVSPGTVRTN